MVINFFLYGKSVPRGKMGIFLGITICNQQDKDDSGYTMIYPKKLLLEMCFPYGTKPEIESGKGNIVELIIEEI
jgi:hypothetical protein